MKKYPEYKQPAFAEIGEVVLAFWQSQNIFEQSVNQREGQPTFTFFEGPPSANGTPGIHHVMARTVKDIFCRYKTQRGFQVKRKGGWDTHGLPVELQVEKELGIKKEDIGKKVSVDAYNQKCRETVMRFKDEWDDLTQKMGYWVDLNDPYITFENKYIETLWSMLKRLYDKDLLYKGYTIQPYSPAAGTGLSSHELNQPGTYQEVKDTSITAMFKVEGSDNEFFLAWTTTPWTLPANNGLAIGANIDYVKVKTFNQYTFQPIEVILAKDCMSRYFHAKAKELALEDYKPGDQHIPYKVVDSMKGKDLAGMAYEQLMPYIPLAKPACTVVIGDFVTTEDGTGIVHISKTFGADDFRTSVQYNMPGVFVKDEEGKDVPIVDKQGKYVAEITDFAGMYVKNEYYKPEERPDKSLDVQISIKLKEENRAFRVEKYEHSYPHCWRTDKPILYYPLDSWFVKTTAYKEKLVALNKTINWKPASTGEGRFGHWLENLVDWNLSRSRYWGTPLPIWVSEDKKEQKCIGSLSELEAEVAKAVAAGIMKEGLAEDFDLHRPYVDDIVLVSETGQKMFREADLIDVWFDSGAMPYAQWHYPFENEDIFENNFPADFIAEGVDQTRGWFFTLHALSVMLHDSVAFKNVIANGLVLDKDGNKMSKRLGNAVDPFKTIKKYGPDATRWYMVANANPWDNLKFNETGVVEVQRRFFGTLHNTYNFFALYANLDNFQFEETAIPLGERPESDRWIISKLNSLILEVTEAYESYEPTKAARAIMDFVSDELSNWYVRLNRKRFWKGAYNNDKKAAYQTLYTCLLQVAKLGAPIAPFYMERLYKDLNGVTQQETHVSIHLSDFPEASESEIAKNLEEQMRLAQVISSLTHSIRKKERIKVRQPLSRIMVPVFDTATRQHIQAVEDLIKSEVNVKSIEFLDDTSDILVKTVKPNFRSLGKKFGPKVKNVATHIHSWGKTEIAEIEKEGKIMIDLGDENTELLLEDVEVSSKDIPGWSVASEGRMTVALDIEINDDLKKEGIARDVVNRIQNLRKDTGLEVQDKIGIAVVRQSNEVDDALTVHEAYICEETQAKKLELVGHLENAERIDMDDWKLEVKITVMS